MLIINADDFGIDEHATDNILLCFQNRRITSTSAMMFMEDSERAANLALDASIAVGLHLNFSNPFSGKAKLKKLNDYHNQIIKFIKKGKYHFLLYNPLLKNQFVFVYQAQYEEFIRLYKKPPTHVDGHHHMHLCTNMVLQNIIPRGMRIRTTFTFTKKEKSILNILYRRIVAYWISKRYICTEFLYSIEPIIQVQSQRSKRLKKIAVLAKSSSVEIMVHPQRKTEYDYLMSEEFFQIISSVDTKSYASL